MCPTTMQWYSLHEHCVAILDKFNFSPFEPSLAAKRALLPTDKKEKYEVSLEAATAGGADASTGHKDDEIQNENENEDNTNADAKNPHPLAEFAPQFPILDLQIAKARKAALEAIPLDIGVGSAISLGQLRPGDVARISPFLEEWLSFVGRDVGSRVPVSLV